MEWLKLYYIINTLEGKKNERKAFVQHQLCIPAEYIYTYTTRVLLLLLL